MVELSYATMHRLNEADSRIKMLERSWLFGPVAVRSHILRDVQEPNPTQAWWKNSP